VTDRQKTAEQLLPGHTALDQRAASLAVVDTQPQEDQTGPWSTSKWSADSIRMGCMHERQGEPTSTGREVLVSRQAIYTPQLEVMAYTLLFDSHADDPGDGGHGYQTIAQGLLTSFLEIGLDTLVGPKRAFLPLTRGFLLLGYVDAFPPDRVVLALPAALTVDHDLIEVLHEVMARGYTIALDGTLAPETLQSLVECASFLRLDVTAVEPPTLEARVASLRQYPLPLVAMQVQTWDAFEACRALGCAYFHGAFVCAPERVKGPQLPTARLALLHVLAQLQNPRITIDALADLISQDVALSYRILRAINAAAYGLARPITSIRQAVALLGLTSITVWTSLMLLAGSKRKPPDLMSIAMVRAKMCEQLAHALAHDDPASCFLVGLFSVLDAFLDRPMAEVLHTLPLADDLRQALLHHEGPCGTILHGALAYERGAWEAVTGLGLDQDVVRDAYLHALTWAARIQHTLTQA